MQLRSPRFAESVLTSRAFWALRWSRLPELLLTLAGRLVRAKLAFLRYLETDFAALAERGWAGERRQAALAELLDRDKVKGHLRGWLQGPFKLLKESSNIFLKSPRPQRTDFFFCRHTCLPS